MAYIRGHFYIWRDGENIHFSHGNHLGDEGENGRPGDNTLCCYSNGHQGPESLALPNYVVDEFVVMRWAQLSDDERAAAVQRVIDKYGDGSFGADAVMEAAGLPTVMDVVRQHIADKA